MYSWAATPDASQSQIYEFSLIIGGEVVTLRRKQVRGHRAVLKRESGVNPGQSRCCEPHAAVHQHKGTTSDIRHYTAAGDTGRRPKPVGGESEDLPESKNADALPRASQRRRLARTSSESHQTRNSCREYRRIARRPFRRMRQQHLRNVSPLAPCPPRRKEHNTFDRCRKHLRHILKNTAYTAEYAWRPSSLLQPPPPCMRKIPMGLYRPRPSATAPPSKPEQ